MSLEDIRNFCIDCNKEISKDSKRCKSCSNHNRKGKYNLKNIHVGYKWSEKARECRKGENNPMWKGDKVGNTCLHKWIARRKLKPIFCEECESNKPYDLANISGEYKRDVNDFRWLCRSCHMKEDGRIYNLKYVKRQELVVVM